MRASLDTNVLIHLYRAGKQKLLFDFFNEGVFIYEQIRNIELEHHGKDVLEVIDQDITTGKIGLFSDDKLIELGVYKMFQNNVKDNKLLYNPGDLGEVYAISLAETLGAYSLITDDIKQGEPYMSLLQFDDEIMPFTFADVIILLYLSGRLDAGQSVITFDSVNQCSNLNWVFKAHLKKFIRRFWTEPYQESEKKWLADYCDTYHNDFWEKIKELRRFL